LAALPPRKSTQNTGNICLRAFIVNMHRCALAKGDLSSHLDRGGFGSPAPDETVVNVGSHHHASG
jgi:hypothetical protein